MGHTKPTLLSGCGHRSRTILEKTRRAPRGAARAVVCALVVLATVGGLVSVRAALANGTAASVPLGDYAGWVNPSGIAKFAATTGTHPTLVTDYLDRSDGWSQMDSGNGMGGWKSSGYRLVLGVPIIPATSGGSLAQGATGAYNQYFATLAQNLVAGGEGNAILRLGWEFNGNWYPWSVANNTDAANFAAYWRQIVNTMRAVPGSDFSFLWNPNSGGSSTWNLALAYPGSAYVDYIGVDIYDECWCTPQTPANSWSTALSENWGLNWLASFAASEGRPIAIPEWSDTFRNDGHGLGDDPNFINQFANWIASNNVAFTNIFSFNDTAGGQDNDITDGRFPNALAAFKADFGGGGSSVPAPTPTTAAPTTTAPPKSTTTTAAPTTTTVAPTTTTTAGQTSGPVTTVTAPPTTPGSTPSGAPGAPVGLTFSVTGGSVTLSWTNQPGTLGIDVFRDGKEIAWPGWPDPAPSSYTDSSASVGTHTYTVAGYNSSGVGAHSGTVTVTVNSAGGTTTTTTSGGTTGGSSSGGQHHHSGQRN